MVVSIRLLQGDKSYEGSIFRKLYAVICEQYRKKEADFGEVLDAKANHNAKVVNEASQAEYKKISFKEMIELKHRVTVAFRQGDLISYERYTNALNGNAQSSIQGNVSIELLIERVRI